MDANSLLVGFKYVLTPQFPGEKANVEVMKKYESSYLLKDMACDFEYVLQFRDLRNYDIENFKA